MKDGDTDHWQLCSKCSVDFKEKFPMRCVSCLKTLDEVAAELDAKDENNINYEMPLETLKFHEDSRDCTDWALIDNRFFCEICYETFILTFRIPATTSNNMFGSEEKQITESRITEALKKRD